MQTDILLWDVVIKILCTLSHCAETLLRIVIGKWRKELGTQSGRRSSQFLGTWEEVGKARMSPVQALFRNRFYSQLPQRLLDFMLNNILIPGI